MSGERYQKVRVLDHLVDIANESTSVNVATAALINTFLFIDKYLSQTCYIVLKQPLHFSHQFDQNIYSIHCFIE